MQIQSQAGFIVLSIAEAQQQDSGYYAFRAVNNAGVAETAATVIVHPPVDFARTDKIDVEDAREMQASMHEGLAQAPQFAQQVTRISH